MIHLNQAWEVRSLDDLDPQGLQLVANFFNEQFPGVFYPRCTPELFEWKLGPNNPAGRGFLTVAICNGLVIGTTSGTRKILSKNGQTFDAIEMGDTFTHPDFRKSGRCISPRQLSLADDEYFRVSVFGRLVSETIFRAKSNGVKYIYSTPNENSKPPYLKRFGFKEIDGEKISSNVIVSAQYKPLRSVKGLVNTFEIFSQFYTRVLSYILVGKNAIHEISTKEFLNHLNLEFSSDDFEFDKVYLLRNKNVLEHRFLMHPSLKYRYFQVTVKGVYKGIMIATSVHRSSGVSSLVVSDWLFTDRKVEKRLALFVSKLRPYLTSEETISFWESEGYSWISKLFLGIMKHKKLSLIGKDLRDVHDSKSVEFGKFPIGWSDNG